MVVMRRMAMKRGFTRRNCWYGAAQEVQVDGRDMNVVNGWLEANWVDVRG
jgi:hypothetical protein